MPRDLVALCLLGETGLPFWDIHVWIVWDLAYQNLLSPLRSVSDVLRQDFLLLQGLFI